MRRIYDGRAFYFFLPGVSSSEEFTAWQPGTLKDMLFVPNTDREYYYTPKGSLNPDSIVEFIYIKCIAM